MPDLAQRSPPSLATCWRPPGHDEGDGDTGDTTQPDVTVRRGPGPGFYLLADGRIRPTAVVGREGCSASPLTRSRSAPTRKAPTDEGHAEVPPRSR